MSHLLSSLVQPVVRQARRFSTAPTDAAQTTAGSLSHVSDNEGNSDSDGIGHDALDHAITHDSPSSPSSLDQLRNRLPRPEFIQRLHRLVAPSAAASASWLESDSTTAPESDDRLLFNSHPNLPENEQPLDTEHHIDPIAQPALPPFPPYPLPDRTRSQDARAVQPQRPGMTSSNSMRSQRNAIHINSSRTSSATSIPRELSGDNEAITMAGTLPENDGMAELRKKIVEIRDMAASSEEKAQRMHQLMTAEYAAHRQLMRPSTPASMVSTERPFTPSSPQCDMIATPAISPASRESVPLDPSNPFNITTLDLQPSYRAKAEHHIADEGSDGDQGEEELELGCLHYKRNVKVQCFDCKQWYPCRHCHDAQAGHKLNRRKTEHMLCMLCQTPQTAAQTCVHCDAEAACYYCGICKLWDDDSTKRIYHCPDCGICRRGEGLGKDYVHCKRCNVCITISHHSSHRCIERATECDCPICGDYMFTSSLSVSALPCGHYMHKSCYQQYMNVSYKCPICQRSAVNMELQWRKLDNAIESQPMPAQFRDTKAEIQCNDCGAKCTSKYHWLGNKCGNCDSYNTSEIRLLGGSDAEDARRQLLRRSPAALHNTAVTASSVPTRDSSQYLRPIARRDSIRTNDERSSSTRSAAQLRSATGGNRSPTSYFLNEQEEENTHVSSFSALAALPSAGILMSPVELLQRVSRSLSPMRHYLEFGTERANVATTDDEDEDEMGFWGGDARSASGGDDEYWEDEDSEEESSDEEDLEDDDDDGDEGGGVWEGIELPGHR